MHRPHHAPVRVLPHVKKLDDALGDFIARVTCSCGASRHVEPEALARIAGRSVTLAALAQRMRCSLCGGRLPRWSRWHARGRAARTVAAQVSHARRGGVGILSFARRVT